MYDAKGYTDEVVESIIVIIIIIAAFTKLLNIIINNDKVSFQITLHIAYSLYNSF